VGGIAELSLTPWLGFRIDMGDTMIFYGKINNGLNTIRLGTDYSMQTSFGVFFRFGPGNATVTHISRWRIHRHFCHVCGQGWKIKILLPLQAIPWLAPWAKILRPLRGLLTAASGNL
jgi:hypothetical protein